MTLAIMQPYIFPYIGYFQMIKAVDKFVFYDDVNFIKQGWINRNNVLISSAANRFTVPLESPSSFANIKDTLISSKIYDSWRSKFLQTLSQNYKKSPHFVPIFELINNVLSQKVTNIGELAILSVVKVAEMLEINTEFRISSKDYDNKELHRVNRIVNICEIEQATTYINAIGGQELYDKNEFASHSIDLKFIKSKPITYPQFKNEFVPWLSIIDVLMFNDNEQINKMLNAYELI